MPSMRCTAVSRTAMMSSTITFSEDATPKSRSAPQVAACILSLFPKTLATSGMAAKVPGSTWAAQPVTTIRASGRSRASLRMVWRAWRVASAVTAQVLTITTSPSPAASAWRCKASDSEALSRQPKVTTSTLMSARSHSAAGARRRLRPRRPSRRSGKKRGRERTLVFPFDRAGHEHVAVPFAPLDRQVAAGQGDGRLSAGEPLAGRGDHGRAGRRPAGAGQARAPFPDPQNDVLSAPDCGERDVGALGEDRVVFEEGPDLLELVGVHVFDEEDRMGIAHVDCRRRVQDRRVDRPDLQLDRAGVLERIAQGDLVPGEPRRAH